MLPQARDSDLLIRTLSDETLVYDYLHVKAHRLTPLEATVWQLCDGMTTVAEIVLRCRERLQFAVPEPSICRALEELARRELLQQRRQSAARPLTQVAGDLWNRGRSWMERRFRRG